MIDVSLIFPAELKPAYDWFEGEGYEPWESFRQSRTGPQWAHLGIFRDGELVGVVSCENRGRSCNYHVATKRRALKPNVLRNILIESTRLFLRGGMKYTSAFIPNENRAAKILALSCGMRLRAMNDTESRYYITAEEFVSRWGSYGA